MSRVVLNPRGINFVLKDARGPVAGIIRRKAQTIFENARSNIATNLNSRTGDLEASLRQIPFDDPTTGFRVVVGADATHRGFPYARALETGVNPWSGEPMRQSRSFAFMVPAVQASGFRRRSAG